MSSNQEKRSKLLSYLWLISVGPIATAACLAIPRFAEGTQLANVLFGLVGLGIIIVLIQRYSRIRLTMFELLWITAIGLNIFLGFKCCDWMEKSWRLSTAISIPISALLGMLPYPMFIGAAALALSVLLGGPVFGPKKPS